MSGPRPTDSYKSFHYSETPTNVSDNLFLRLELSARITRKVAGFSIRASGRRNLPDISRYLATCVLRKLPQFLQIIWETLATEHMHMHMHMQHLSSLSALSSLLTRFWRGLQGLSLCWECFGQQQVSRYPDLIYYSDLKVARIEDINREMPQSCSWWRKCDAGSLIWTCC